MQLARLPDRVLPPPGRRPLPEPVALRHMIGPSVILAGLSIGSGELILWPRLTAEWGFALFWACWIGVSLQYFLNMEIERYSLATGESAVVGFVRLARVFGPVFFVCATVPWIWPGWSTGAATLLEWELGLPVVPTAIAGLVLCGAILSVGPVVYRTVEVLQLALVSAIFVALLGLSALLVDGATVLELARGALRIGHVPQGIHLPLLLGALAFAGAGGSVNLAQSNYIKDKGYGMGRWIGRITSPFTGREEAESELGYVFDGDAENLARWRIWWWRSDVEHFVSFFLLCLLSLVLFCLLAASLLEPGAHVGDDFGFLRAEARAIDARFGGAARVCFTGVGVAVLFSTELALLDAVSRVASDLLKIGPFRERGVSVSRLYFAVLWGMIAFGVLVLLSGLDRPFVLLVLSAALNGIVMFLYSGLLLWLNLASFRGPLRPHPVRIGALLCAFAFFGYFSVLTALDQLGRWG